MIGVMKVMKGSEGSESSEGLNRRKGLGEVANDRMYDVVLDYVEGFRGEFTDFLSWTPGVIDAWYVSMLLRGYSKEFDRASRDWFDRAFGGSEEDFRLFRVRFGTYMDELLDLYNLIRRVQHEGDSDGFGVIDDFLEDISYRKFAFSDPEEYALYMRTFLGNAAFREDAVRKRRVKLWRVEFDAFEKDRFARLDYVLFMNVICEVERYLVMNTGLLNMSSNEDTWTFRSIFSQSPKTYASKKEECLEYVLNQLDVVVEVFTNRERIDL